VPTEAKNEAIKTLNEKFSRSSSAIMADYQGISAVGLTEMRCFMRERSIEFLVVKNTLARMAVKETQLEILDGKFKGPVSLVVSYDDPIGPAKAIEDFSKTQPEKGLKVLGGVIDGKMVSPSEVQVLAKLPPKEVLVAQMLSAMQGPTTNFVGLFQGLLRKFVGTLEAVKDKKVIS
tara:strand:- start:4010 stop:4537 length:528 start_codon:yes stop_codon:yes gene_type:complete